MPNVNCDYLFSTYIPAELHLVLIFCLLLFTFLILIKQVKSSIDFGLVSFLVGAGFFNLADRLKDGCVTDPYNFFNLFWFNIPDIIITVCALTLIVRLCITEKMLGE
jgi:lipoprotein signal peptidase